MRAYLRLDPDLPEHKEDYPDGALAAFTLALCFAEQQPKRGHFKSEKLLRALLLKRSRWIRFLIERKDLVKMADGSLYFDGWDEWQEGDWKVRERVSRIRNRHHNQNAVTPDVTPQVTLDVTVPTVNKLSDIAVSGKRYAVSITEPLQAELSQGQLDVAIVLEECLTHPLSAVDIQACGVWLTKFRYLDPTTIIDRLRSHVLWCIDTNRHIPKTAAGFHETLRRENDYRADQVNVSARIGGSGLTKIGSVLEHNA